MAPELAISELSALPKGSIVLDPMAGSGTVLRQASEHGHSAIGFDMDPMAVLISRVWTTPVSDRGVERLHARVVSQVRRLGRELPALPWIDEDEETAAFVRYWFAPKQRDVLRRIAFVLADGRTASSNYDVLRVALSRIIITKDRGASLARDVSHSRPHKVETTSPFDVIDAFERSVATVRRLLAASPPPGEVEVGLGDARQLTTIDNGSVDLVLTSPPYLNQIDYIRGHRLALVWFGHRLTALRSIRASTIGAERAPDRNGPPELFHEIVRSMAPANTLSPRHGAMVSRYAEDIYRMMSEIARVLRPRGRAVLVIGNSCLKDTFIRNTRGIATAASMVGLRVQSKTERRLPVRRRYLPMPKQSQAPLGRRMRTESILSLTHT
jgi:SAM-dependent methyltransferase